MELPAWAGDGDQELAKLGYSFWKNPKNIQDYLPEYEGSPIRDFIRRIYFAKFDFDPEKYIKADETTILSPSTILLFVYQHKGNRVIKIDTGGVD